VSEELKRGAIGPVEVVQHHDHRTFGRRFGQHRVYGLEEAKAVGVGFRGQCLYGHVRDAASEIGDQAREIVRDRSGLRR
jgi:hypothetical protein